VSQCVQLSRAFSIFSCIEHVSYAREYYASVWVATQAVYVSCEMCQVGTHQRRRYNTIPISWISIQLFPPSSPPLRRSFSHPGSPPRRLPPAPWGYLWRKSAPVLLQEEAA